MVVLSKLNFDDISFTMLESVFWTVIEPSLVIINACIPTMRPVLQAALVRVWYRATGSGSGRELDEYPLTDRRDVLHVPQITAGHAHGLPGQPLSPRGLSSQVPVLGKDGAYVGNAPTGGIHVKKEWEVSD